MSESHARPEGAGSESGATPEAYQKPGVAWEEDLEARPGLVVACNKNPGQSFFCDQGTQS